MTGKTDDSADGGEALQIDLRVGKQKIEYKIVREINPRKSRGIRGLRSLSI